MPRVLRQQIGVWDASGNVLRDVQNGAARGLRDSTNGKTGAAFRRATFSLSPVRDGFSQLL